MWTVSEDTRPDLVGDADRLVDRDREALAAGTHPVTDRRGRGDAHDLAGAVDHRATRVAGADRRGELDQAGQLVGGTGQRVLGVDRAPERGDAADLAGQRRGRTLGVAQRDDGLTGGQRGRVADRRDRQSARTEQLDHRDVTAPVVADQLGGKRPARDGGVDPVGALDDVVVGQYLTTRIEHDAGARPEGVLVVDLGVDARDGGLDGGRRRERISRCGARGGRNQGDDKRKRRGQDDRQPGQPTKTEHAHGLPFDDVL